MSKKKENKIDLDCDKEVLVNTDKKSSKDKKAKLGDKKKRRADDDFEDMMQGEYSEKMLNNVTKRFNDKMDISDNSKEVSEEEDVSDDSDSEEDVLVDDDHNDDSDEFEINKSGEEDEDEDMEVEGGKKNKKVNIWDENSKLKEGQELDFDNEAYEMLHRANPEWPCMTIDFIIPQHFVPPINDFYKKQDYTNLDKAPYDCYMVAGSQTNTQNGFLYYMKWSNMHKTKYDDDPDKGADSDDEEAQNPLMRFEKIQTKGNINRIKTMKNSYLTAYWSDTPTVEIVDMRSLIQEMEEESSKYDKKNKENNLGKNKKRKLNTKDITLKTFNRQQEGFAIEWGWVTPGILAAGGYDKKIEIYIPTDESCTDWILNSQNLNNTMGILKGHKGAVEDIIWSPHQANVLASCSTDKSIMFWDLRVDKNSPPIVCKNAHESDVNCLSWNLHVDFMIASGGDDNAFKVWDLRHLDNGPISDIRWHKGPITAISWDPYEDSQLAVSSEDNRLSVWDFAVEPDDQTLFDATNQEIPQQLIFLHQGQENIKDLKFHPQFRNFIVSTAENGINVFKPAFDDEDDSIATDDDNMEIDDS
jgi:ribosome assembly protein RRB1